MKGVDLKKKAAEVMMENFRNTGYRYIAPSPLFHFQFRWDSAKHSIICSKLGLEELAKNELKSLLKVMDKDGFIPAVHFHKHSRYESFKKPLHKIYTLLMVERYLFKTTLMSGHTQPPLEALALSEIKHKDKDFVRKYLPLVIKAYMYFYNYRDEDKDNLVEVYHPHETGRDGDPIFDRFLTFPNLNKFYFFHMINITLLNLKYKLLGWNIKKIRKLSNLVVEDVMFNVFYILGLYEISNMAKELNKPYKKYENLAHKSEHALYDLMWSNEHKIFFSLDKENRKIEIKSITGIFPIMLPNIDKRMALSLLKTMKKEFFTPYPLASVSKNEPYFIPHWTPSYSIWRGAVWLDVNYFIVNGLKLQYKRFKDVKFKHAADYISKKTRELLLKNLNNGIFREFYDPITGEGQRANQFGWSCLGALL